MPDESRMSKYQRKQLAKARGSWKQPEAQVALSIIAMVDEEYGVTLKGDDIKNATTVQDIFNRVVALKG